MTDIRYDKEAPGVTLAARLEAQEREWRERKARRAFRGLADVAGQLRARFAGRSDVIVALHEQSVAVELGAERELELSLRLSFDHTGEMHQWFMVRDQTVRRESGYEEIDSEAVFTEMSEAVAFMVGSASRR
jgi:hypothetical protein